MPTNPPYIIPGGYGATLDCTCCEPRDCGQGGCDSCPPIGVNVLGFPPVTATLVSPGTCIFWGQGDPVVCREGSQTCWTTAYIECVPIVNGNEWILAWESVASIAGLIASGSIPIGFGQCPPPGTYSAPDDQGNPATVVIT